MKDYTKNVISRRKMLKSTAAMGAAAGASIMLGCPAVHANEAPTIRYLGLPSTWVASQKSAFLKIQGSKSNIYQKPPMKCENYPHPTE